MKRQKESNASLLSKMILLLVLIILLTPFFAFGLLFNLLHGTILSIVKALILSFFILGFLLFQVFKLYKSYRTGQPTISYEEGMITRKQKRKKGVHSAEILSNNEFYNIDKNQDGKISVSEFYSLSEKEIVKKITEIDPTFSKSAFYSWVKQLMLHMQIAWSNRDYHFFRIYESDTLYQQHRFILEEQKNSGIFERRKNIRIKGALLKDFYIDGGKEVIIVAVAVCMRQYEEDEQTKQISNRNTSDVSYLLTFSRNSGVKSKKSYSFSSSNCPNCGAVIDVVDDRGICSYCGTSLVSGEYDWVLVDIEKVTFEKVIVPFDNAL